MHEVHGVSGAIFSPFFSGVKSRTTGYFRKVGIFYANNEVFHIRGKVEIYFCHTMRQAGTFELVHEEIISMHDPQIVYTPRPDFLVGRICMHRYVVVHVGSFESKKISL